MVSKPLADSALHAVSRDGVTDLAARRQTQPRPASLWLGLLIIADQHREVRRSDPT